MDEILKLIIASVFSSAVAAAVISIIFKKKTERISNEIKNQFELLSMMQKTGHAWNEKAVSELYGPMNFQFARTKLAFSRYSGKNEYLEAKILKDGNEKIKNLILEKSYLIPPDLMEYGNKLVAHYDVWLEEYSKFREAENPTELKEFIFAGPNGFPFPRDAEQKFKEKYADLWNKLYS